MFRVVQQKHGFVRGTPLIRQGGVWSSTDGAWIAVVANILDANTFEATDSGAIDYPPGTFTPDHVLTTPTGTAIGTAITNSKLLLSAAGSTTITNISTAASAAATTGGLNGSGIDQYYAKWTGTALSYGQLREDASSLYLGATLTLTATMATSATPITAPAFLGDGSALTALNGSSVTTGTIADARLSANATLQGNTFNTASKLVQLDGSTRYPALDGSLITALNGSAVATGTIADARLSANVPLLVSGNLGIGVTPTAGNGLLQLASGTTKANGIAFSADTFLHRVGAGLLTSTGSNNSFLYLQSTLGAEAFFGSDGANAYFGGRGAFPLHISTDATTAITIDTSQNCTFYGYIKGKSAKPTLTTLADVIAYLNANFQ